MEEPVDITIIGAGVVGLAIAEALAAKNRQVVIVEKNDTHGRETSSRNSEVIHAGIYYRKELLKSRLCVTGNSMLFAWCEQKGVPCRRIGKLIVATAKEEEADLEKIKAQADENGVPGLALLGRIQVKTMEPEVTALGAVYSPHTGIIDTHSLMMSLRYAAEAKDAVMICRAEVTAIDFDGKIYTLAINGGRYRIRTKVLINSAGLHADHIAAMAGLDIERMEYRLKFCKGNYFSASPSPRLRHLIYPVPVKDNIGLGIHATLDLSGRVRFGPDARYLPSVISGKRTNRHIPPSETIAGFDYSVDEGLREGFYESIRKYLPQISLDALHPDMSGIRPKLQGPGEAPRDFVIQEESAAGFPGLVNLIGIESPGLTSCLAIGAYVRSLLQSP
ncbi:MAG: L-2-hydroxyglutarate dehydrogenase [Syntrophus sp. SKADARSKE-3]|nr:L-2-hydroxyglutarate dehydrogenase [Syntrophus sp. SKADARSKE-3]